MDATTFEFADIALNLFLSLLVLIGTILVYRMIGNTIKRRIEDATRMQSIRVAVRNVLGVAGFMTILLIWLRNPGFGHSFL